MQYPVYKSVCAEDQNQGRPQISTSLNAEQLRDLLKKNGLDVEVIAYAAAPKSKGILFVIRPLKKK